MILRMRFAEAFCELQVERESGTQLEMASLFVEHIRKLSELSICALHQAHAQLVIYLNL